MTKFLLIYHFWNHLFRLVFQIQIVVESRLQNDIYLKLFSYTHKSSFIPIGWNNSMRK
jgi:hypothetical protein